jgi:two-component system, response regulator PdtaR
MRVLIAEDETIVRLDLRQVLERYGFFVCAEARDGVEAVSLARTSNPDAAILDLRMPNLDGIEAAQRIYAESPIPIVMLTAFNDRATVEKAVAAGVFGYLVKPFREGDIAPALHAAAARHADLLGARRHLGSASRDRIEITLPSRAGNGWPVRIQRAGDGSVDVRVSE